MANISSLQELTVLRRGRGIVLIVPGTMARLAPHAGGIPALRRLLDKMGKRLDLVLATSAGAIDAAATMGGTEEAYSKLRNRVVNLKPNQIYTYEPSLKYSFFSILGAALFIITILALSKLMPTWVVVIMGTLAVASLAASGYYFGYSFKSIRAPLSTMPLFRLLKNGIDMRSVFGSRTELRVVATDIEKPGPVIFSSKEPGKCDADNPEHCDRFINILRASSALLLFPWIEVDGKCLGDGEFWTDFPIQEARGYRKVIVLEYWEGHGRQFVRRPHLYIEYVMRVFDIMRDKIGYQKRIRYKQEASYGVHEEDSVLPDIMYIRASDELLKSMPTISLTNFNREKMEEAIKFGEAVIEEQADAIRHYLEN